MAYYSRFSYFCILFHSPKGSWNKSQEYEKLEKYLPYCTRHPVTVYISSIHYLSILVSETKTKKDHVPLHKVNVTKSKVSCGFGNFYWKSHAKINQIYLIWLCWWSLKGFDADISICLVVIEVPDKWTKTTRVGFIQIERRKVSLCKQSSLNLVVKQSMSIMCHWWK